MSIALGIVSLIVGVGSSQQAAQEASSAAYRQEEARRKQTAMEQTKLTQSRRQQIREERRRRAQILQRAETLGVSGSAGEIGAIGALATTTAANIGAQTGEGVAIKSVSSSLQRAAESEARAESFAAVSNLSMNVFQQTGGFQNIFKGTKKVT